MPKLKISTVKFSKGRVFVLSFFMVALLAIPTTVYLVGQQLNATTKAEKSTTLAFNPVTATAKTGDKLSFEINLSPGTNVVNYVKVVIKYDPHIFSTDDKSFTIDPSSKLKLTEGPNIASGSVLMVFALTNPADTVTTDSKIGIINFNVDSTSSTEAQISFDSTQTQIKSLGSGDTIAENVFQSGMPATVTINNSNTDTQVDNITATENNGTPTLTTPTANEQVSDQRPSFEGTAAPNESVSITIHSSQTITGQVTTDTNGNWNYTPTTTLTPGTHTITISSKDSNGVLKTITQTFSVLAQQAEASGQDSTSPVCNSLTSDVLTSGKAPYTIGFTANGSDDTGTIEKVSFNFGDGKTADITQGTGIGTATVSATTTHTYQTAGSFNATATVTNDQGSVSDSNSCNLSVTITGSSSAALSPIPATGPGPAIVGIGAVGGIIFLIGALFFFVL